MTTQMVRACDNSGHHVLLIIKKMPFGISTKMVWNRCVGFETWCELIKQYFFTSFLIHNHFCPLFAAAKCNATTFSQHRLKTQIAVFATEQKHLLW